jgi:dGTPase
MPPGNPWPAKKQAEVLNSMITAHGAVAHVLTDAEQEGNPRLPLQRDRDRIVWSRSFRRLAYKTQVFPHVYTDHQRNRLTHSLDVMQLSSSIARTLGLNPLLCEAIALGHDLGHTPFGHPGEVALDDALREIKIENLERHFRGLARFSHYEQGVDVVAYMDSELPQEDASGLHVHQVIREGILKHTYDFHSDAGKHKSLKFLQDNTKYDDIKDGLGTLESQVVRICDKVSYFFSDIEDGLIIGALHLEDLRAMPLFSPMLAAVKEHPASGGSDYRAFQLARDRVLTEIVESVLTTGVVAEADAPAGQPRIHPGKDVGDQMQAIYAEVQKDRLFRRNILVMRENQRARHIVSCLLCQYLRHPELIPWRFRSKYVVEKDNAYHQRLTNLYLIEPKKGSLLQLLSCNMKAWHAFRAKGNEAMCPGAHRSELECVVADLVCVKDYVAGMTDDYAISRFHADVICNPSREAWEEYEMGRRPALDTWYPRKD